VLGKVVFEERVGSRPRDVPLYPVLLIKDKTLVDMRSDALCYIVLYFVVIKKGVGCISCDGYFVVLSMQGRKRQRERISVGIGKLSYLLEQRLVYQLILKFWFASK
jgi:hypothetical protein